MGAVLSSLRYKEKPARQPLPSLPLTRRRIKRHNRVQGG